MPEEGREKEEFGRKLADKYGISLLEYSRSIDDSS